MSETSSSLRAGTAEVNITPPIGTQLTGYGGRVSGCIGIHDDIFARALVLDNGTASLAIVTCDLLGVDRDTVDAVRQGAHEQTGIPPDNIMISCSHTHSGPASMQLGGIADRDELYVKMLNRKITGAISAAKRQLQPAVIGFGREPVRCGNNRRERTPDGKMVLGVNPSGKVAPYVNVMKVAGTDGTPIAVLFNHAAHAVALRGNNLLVSADYPGFAARLLKKAKGDSLVPMFAQGCCGDINCRYFGTFAEAERVGNILGAAVLKRMEEIEEHTDTVQLDSRLRVAKLPLQQPPSVQEAEQILVQARKELQQAQESGNPLQVKVRSRSAEWAEELLALAKEGEKPRTRDFEIQILRIGDAAIVGMAGEVFVEYQLWVDEQSPFRHNFVHAYTNGVIGYVPTADEFPKGGYEIEVACKYYPGTLMLSPECERVIKETIAQMFDEIKPQ